ncbi:Uncharacterised protein (plasmid) [Tsukamurella tyrosinosolvens]|uniref:Uncharacterized protein n=1 Tax=Tsukamurella tyrosinosolvens TaxID=57704 RepID=A0A1H4VLQ3_TSUTY|nr:hypothetical protein [Tsukamurella tyrosinosolvens]KXO90944.1 hypothetical protein AXK58_21155 [Tsukamurella tyrosinosolvens]SEC81875.1 hypothetical protein SAMN04489793_3267 [Tsukamurella tyrosinosolvens]VEH90440.1 Uncharacterised protein [Tsukamurella tyrosinosolvens]
MPNAAAWFVIGALTLPSAFLLFAGVQWLWGALGRAWIAPRELSGKSLQVRRSVVVMAALELLDARHVRIVRLPFNRIVILRSNPRRQYDWDSDGLILIGDAYEHADEVFERAINTALDQLGYSDDTGRTTKP